MKKEMIIQDLKECGVIPKFGKYSLLVAAIIEQAIKDLRVAKKQGDFAQAACIRKWFLSDWGQSLTGGNGRLIIERIEREDREKRQNET